MKIEESHRKQIAQELKINQSAQCPYIVVCYQSFYDNGSIYIILEYMDGGSLADFLKKVKKIQEPYLAVLCKQVGIRSLAWIWRIDFCTWFIFRLKEIIVTSFLTLSFSPSI